MNVGTVKKNTVNPEVITLENKFICCSIFLPS